LDNSLDLRWRGRLNEDTDLSLRVMKEGYCTILFNAFTCGKAATLTMKGGNTDELYKAAGDNRLSFAQSLQAQHPDVVQIIKRWGRWHHLVDYTVFEKNHLILKNDLNISKGINEYGMVLKKVQPKLDEQLETEELIQHENE